MGRKPGYRKLSEGQIDSLALAYVTPAPDGSWFGSDMLAKEYGISASCVGNYLHQRGVAIRDAKQAHSNGKRCKPIKNVAVGNPPRCACNCGGVTAWNQRKNQWNVYIGGHYRKQYPYKDRSWLEANYVNGSECASSIAKQFGVNLSTIFKSVDRLGIQRKPLSQVHIGKNVGSENGAWCGGTTPARQKFCRLPAWKQLVRSVFERDGFRCIRCGTKKISGISFHCHHICSWARHPELRLDTDNCVTLCQKCHNWVHSKENMQNQYLILHKEKKT